MLTIILGIFCILHGLVHLLYAGQSRRLFELRPGMVWPMVHGCSRDCLAMRRSGCWRVSCWRWPRSVLWQAGWGC